jgi:glucose/arabinose dehydrogenase
MDRRAFVTATTGLFAALAGCNQSPEERSPDSSPTDPSSPVTASTETHTADVPDSVGLERVVTGLDRPVDVVFPADSALRYVAQQGGRIQVIDDGSVRSRPLLDLRSQLSTGYEKGLLGIALHPEFAETRRLFVRYSAPPRDDTPTGYSHAFVLSEFRVGDDGYEVTADSERELLTIPQPQPNHNAGSVLFGPDDYLYVGVGDGGGGGDQGTGHVRDWYDAVDGGNGQNVTENLLGSILRIDVDDQQEELAYAIPDANPLIGGPGRDEQYAWGFRNPWRLSFDGDQLYAGDVGQNRYEEINRVRKGGNYGWNVKEGTHCFQADDCPDEKYPDVRGGEPLRDPVIEYPHGNAPVSGVSVIIGNVYRGSAVPGLQGRFVFGDFRAEGRLFVAEPGADGLWETAVLPVNPSDAAKLQQIYSFSRQDGEIYVLCTGSENGGVFRLRS